MGVVQAEEEPQEPTDDLRLLKGERGQGKVTTLVVRGSVPSGLVVVAVVVWRMGVEVLAELKIASSASSVSFRAQNVTLASTSAVLVLMRRFPFLDGGGHCSGSS